MIKKFLHRIFRKPKKKLEWSEPEVVVTSHELLDQDIERRCENCKYWDKSTLITTGKIQLGHEIVAVYQCAYCHKLLTETEALDFCEEFVKREEEYKKQGAQSI